MDIFNQQRVKEKSIIYQNYQKNIDFFNSRVNNFNIPKVSFIQNILLHFGIFFPDSYIHFLK